MLVLPAIKSKKKKQFIRMFYKRKTNPVINIKMYGKQLEQVSVIRFLGMWMDTKLNFRIHIQKMVAKSNTFNEVFGRS